MSAIDELKNPGIVIDATNGEDSQDDGIYIDASSDSDNAVNRVDLSNLTRRQGSHQIVRPTNKSANKPQQSNSRKPITIDSVAKPDPKEAEAHVSPLDDMINPDNPNSMFSNYVKERDEEAREWITAREEEQAILKEEDASLLKGEIAGSSIIKDDYDTSNTPLNITMEDDLDISNLFDNKENKMEEKINMVDEKKEIVPDESIDIDSFIDTEDLPEAASDDKEDSIIEEDDLSTSDGEVIGKIEDEKETSYDAPDIDVVEENQVFVTNIEDDDDTAATAVAETDDTDVLKHLQKLATEKLKPVSNQLDISSFTILKKPVINIAPIFKESSARVVKWILPAQESIVLMKEFSGSELEKLREYSENARSVDALNRRFHMIYDHIVSPKPATFEQWLKSTPYEDIDHYFFSIYVACFKGANFLPHDCVNKKCGETFLTDDINIMDMVKFDTKEAKEKFAELYQSEATPAGKGVYCTEVVPMNNKIAIAFRQPSIYNLFEKASLDDRTRNNYSAIIDYIPYIDTIYTIDMEERSLTPITYKTFPDNAQRTIRSKIQKYDTIFNMLSVDDFGPVKAYIRALTEKSTGMRYVYPTVECPKCHTMTTELQTTAEELVFTRYQLGALVTTSLS